MQQDALGVQRARGERGAAVSPLLLLLLVVVLLLVVLLLLMLLLLLLLPRLSLPPPPLPGVGAISLAEGRPAAYDPELSS